MAEDGADRVEIVRQNGFGPPSGDENLRAQIFRLVGGGDFRIGAKGERAESGGRRDYRCGGAEISVMTV